MNEVNDAVEKLDRLSSRMKYYRFRQHLTIAECASRVGVSPSTYRDWEYGRAIRGEPYQNIARALGVSTTKLLGLEETKTKRDLEDVLLRMSLLNDNLRDIISKL